MLFKYFFPVGTGEAYDVGAKENQKVVQLCEMNMAQGGEQVREGRPLPRLMT